MNGIVRKLQLLSILLICISLPALPALANKGHFATLEEFNGEVMIKNAGAWTRPQLDMPLFSGSKIVTKDGTALVVFKDGATMFIDEFSSIRTIDQPVKESKAIDGKSRIRKIRIMLGRAKYHEQPLSERETRIELPTAVAALRGTGGWFGSDENQNSLGQLYEGNMEIFGSFQEVIPKILTLARALNSPTFQASLNSAQAQNDPILNVKEVQSEIETFAANTDPQVQAAVQKVIEVITPLLKGIETKLEKAKAASGVKEKAQKTAEKTQSEAASQAADQIKESASNSADTFVEAAQQSMNTDIVLVLETLKGDEEGIQIAMTIKAQNDSALDLAQAAVETQELAVELVGKAENTAQLETAVLVSQTAKNSVETAAKSIETANASAELTAKDNKSQALDVAGLSAKTNTATAVAAKSIAIAQTALEMATENQDLDTALAAAKAAQTTSQTTQNTAQIGSRAADAILNNSTESKALAQATEAAAASVETASQAVDTIQNALETGNTSEIEKATQEIEKAAQESETIKTDAGVSTDTEGGSDDDTKSDQTSDDADTENTDESDQGNDTEALAQSDEDQGQTPEEPEAFEEAAPDDPPAVVTPTQSPEPEFNPEDNFIDDSQPASPI